MIEIASKDSPYKKLSDRVGWIMQSFDNARDFHNRRIDRCMKNWRFYVAHDPELGFGQWPEDSVTYMLNQNRQITQYNFIKVIVDTIAGGIMQVPFDPEIYPINRIMNQLTSSIMQGMYSDKELLDWPAVYFELVRGGLIFESAIKMFISREYDDLGNIGFKTTLPGSVMADPLWRSWSSKDCQKCWHEQWFTPEQLIEIYPDKEDLIRFELAAQKNLPHEYGDYQGPTPGLMVEGQWGSTHRLIQQYEMIEETIQQEYAVTAEGKIAIPDIPDTDKPAWLNRFHPTWQPDLVFTKPEKVKRCYVTAVSPTLSPNWEFELDKTEIQIGRLPYFWWSASRANGEPDSIVDSIKDAQQTINYMESLITYKIQIEGGGGSQFVDPGAFASTEEYERYKVQRNNPAAMFETVSGLLQEGKTPAVPTQKSSFPREAYEHINHMVNVILPHISKVTPAMRGIGEGQGESGKLFELMKIQSDQQVYTIHYGLRIFWNEVYEAYFLEAVDLYSQEDVERTFVFNEGHDSVKLNEKVRDSNGNLIGIKNHVSTLKNVRHKVIISEKQSSPTERLELLDKIGKFIKNLAQNGVAKPATIQYLVNKSADLMGLFDDEELTRLQDINQAELETQLAQLENSRLKTMLENHNLKQQLDNIQRKAAMGTNPGGDQTQTQPPPAAPEPQAPAMPANEQPQAAEMIGAA